MSMKDHWLGRFARFALAAGFLLLVRVPSSYADLLPIVPIPSGPSILSFAGTLQYDSGTGNFHSETVPLSLSGGGTPNGLALFSGDTTTIDLFVDPSGNFLSSGLGVRVTGGLDLDGDGTIDVTGTDANPLLFGKITAFGADPAGPPTRAFDGLFDIQGGLLTQPVALSGGGTASVGFMQGNTGGFFLFAESVTTGTLGDFSQSFASDSVKSEVFTPVPEPATATLGLVGFGALLGWIACRRSRRSEQ
jgi:hypothetical protein